MNSKKFSIDAHQEYCQVDEQSQFNPNDAHPSIHFEKKSENNLPREDETMKFIVGSEGVAMAVTQPE
jgi:hypothetical protein